MKNISFYLLTAMVSVIVLTMACRKEETFLKDGGRVSYSTDTLFFDTVFTALKSSTRRVKVYNQENRSIKVSIRMKEMDKSSFYINVDGQTGRRADDVVIRAKDSTIVFVNALIDTTAEVIPFVIEDELITEVNGHAYGMPVLAYGQNAVYIYDSVLTTATFTDEKPYVIIKGALVEEGSVLTVEAGTRIYMHQDARMYVEGSLIMNGTLEAPVRMMGDRLDRDVYVGSDSDLAGEWGGLYFLEKSHGNIIDYAIIKNGGLSTKVGTQSTLPALIQVDKDISGGSAPKLKITNSIIKNAYQYGIISFGGSIYAENCVLVNAQQVALALLEGGTYTFNDCTIGIYGHIPLFSRSSQSASVLAQNFYEPVAGTVYGKALDLTFNNCIISGNFENEFITHVIPDFPSSIRLNNCLVQSAEGLKDYVAANDCLLNISPDFVDITESDFHINLSSPLIGKGIAAGEINTDIDGVTRAHPPTIGAYEPQP